MLQLTGAGKRFGPKILFQDLNWLINPKDHIGLVGANGTGKSTLLKVLAGIEQLDYGTSSLVKGLQAGYLPQDGLSLSGRSVFQECMSVFADLQDMEKELESLAHRMADTDPASSEYNQIANRVQRLDSEFRARDGYMIEAHVGTVLSGLGFHKDEWAKRTEDFSGGWQMRIALAKLLLQKPNLLLLDEPTNHLDLEARNWLEEYLSGYPFAFVLISHDRFFLDMTATRTVEIWNKGVHFYNGNFSKYEGQKNERRALLESAYRNQREKIEQLESWINRFRAQATKAKQVQSRIKELEKIERIEIPPEEKTIHFSFPQPKPSGRVVAEFTKVSKSYGEKKVFANANFIVERGDRIALVGVNGAGKSTLIKLLTGTEPLSSGEYRLGHNVEPDYFAQDQYKELDADSTMLEDLTEASPRTPQTELRSLLGCFLFSEDDVFKRIGVLSGGERNRYALARMLLHPSNFLLLDEPTNHLDMRAKDVLLQSLQEFTGTVVFVSHDRYFIDKLATRIIEVENGEIRVYPGNYEDYLWRKSQDQAVPPVPVNGNHTASAVTVMEEPKAAPSAKRLNPMKLQQMQNRCSAVEQEISDAEADVARYEQQAARFESTEETVRVAKLLESRRQDLDRLMAEWETLSETIAANA